MYVSIYITLGNIEHYDLMMICQWKIIAEKQVISNLVKICASIFSILTSKRFVSNPVRNYDQINTGMEFIHILQDF